MPPIPTCLKNIGKEIAIAAAQFRAMIAKACFFCIDRLVGKTMRMNRSMEIAVSVSVEKHRLDP